MSALFSYSALIFFATGMAAMAMHAFKKWIANEIVGSVIDWYVMHPKATAAAVMACVGGIASAVLTGVLTDCGQGAQIIAAWGIGYAADTVNNQGQK